MLSVKCNSGNLSRHLVNELFLFLPPCRAFKPRGLLNLRPYQISSLMIF